MPEIRRFHGQRVFHHVIQNAAGEAFQNRLVHVELRGYGLLNGDCVVAARNLTTCVNGLGPEAALAPVAGAARRWLADMVIHSCDS